MVNERDIGKTVITPRGWGKLYKIEEGLAFVTIDGYGSCLMYFPLNDVKLPTIIGKKEVRK